MPNRIVRESILSSEPVASLKWDEEVFYRRLMSLVDDYGRFEANPLLLRSRCYPLQTDHVRVADITRWMAACQKAGLILDYAVDGKRYLEIQKFQQQQRTASKYPAPASHDIACNHLLADAHLVVSVFEGVSDNTSASAEVFLRDSKAPAEGPTVDSLLAGVSPQVVADFKQHRKVKKAPITVTALEGIQREAAKAGVTLQRALAECCQRGWVGFKADWFMGQGNTTPTGPTPPKRKELA